MVEVAILPTNEPRASWPLLPLPKSTPLEGTSATRANMTAGTKQLCKHTFHMDSSFSFFPSCSSVSMPLLNGKAKVETAATVGWGQAPETDAGGARTMVVTAVSALGGHLVFNGELGEVFEQVCRLTAPAITHQGCRCQWFGLGKG